MKTRKLLLAGIGLLVAGSVAADTFYLQSETGGAEMDKDLWFDAPTGGSTMTTLGADFAGNRFNPNGHAVATASTGVARTFPGTFEVGAAGTPIIDVFSRDWTIFGMDLDNTVNMRGRVWNAPAILSIGDLDLGSSGQLRLRTHNSNSTDTSVSITGSLTGSGILEFGHNAVGNDLNATWNLSITGSASTFSGTVDLDRGQLTFSNALALNNAAFTIDAGTEDNTIVLANAVSFGSMVYGATSLAADTYTADELNTLLGTARFSGSESLTVIPEPATIGLLGVFSAGLLLARRIFTI